MNSSTVTSPSTRTSRRRRGPPPLRVGLTGGIASGKSTVAALFAQLGVPVIDTDRIARDVVEPGSPVLADIEARFGPGILAPDGRLDRRALRTIVFADAQARQDLEALTHPAIETETQRRSAAAGGEYQLIAVPLLAEKGLKSRYDRVLVVDCDPAAQLQRLVVRDGSTEAGARAILAAQADRADRLAMADDVIGNDGDIHALTGQVEALHARYRALAASRRTPVAGTTGAKTT
jgi:dephospho-CoA kinase